MDYLFTSDRLGFRNIDGNYREELYRINSHPPTMAYFPKCLNRQESEVFLRRIMDHRKNYGFSLLAVHKLDGSDFIGILGFLKISFRGNFQGQVEIGWRLHEDYWNRGYATEAARKLLDWGFKKYNFPTVYSFTSLGNKPSQNVMKKLGML